MALRDIAKKVRSIHEAITSGIRGPIASVRGVGGTKREDTKRPIDPDAPIEPIEAREAAAAAANAKPASSFAAMVDAAKKALLNGEDPHEAVEQLTGTEEGGNEDQIVKAVRAAIGDLEIKEPGAKMEPSVKTESRKGR